MSSTSQIRATSAEWTLVHDFCFDYGGAERVLDVVANCLLPESEVWLLGGSDHIIERMGLSDRANFLLPRWALSHNTYRHRALTLAPLLFRRRAPTNVLALSYAFAHYVPAAGRKIVYCHSPLRQVWSGLDDYQASVRPMARGLFGVGGRAWRHIDRRAARRAALYLATSNAVAGRLDNYYGINDPPILPPPVDTTVFTPGSPETYTTQPYYLWVGRVVEPYKRLSLLMEVFRSLPSERLVVAGSGRDLISIERTAPPNVEFVGPADTDQLVRLYRDASAVIFPSNDDFGLVPLEAMACSTPVVALRAGGALDTVVDGKTGIFFDEPTADILREALSRLKRIHIDPRAVREHALRFDVDSFIHRLAGYCAAVTSS